MRSSPGSRNAVVKAIAVELAPIAFRKPDVWYTPQLKRARAKLQASALSKARRILRIVERS